MRVVGLMICITPSPGLDVLQVVELVNTMHQPLLKSFDGATMEMDEEDAPLHLMASLRANIAVATRSKVADFIFCVLSRVLMPGTAMLINIPAMAITIIISIKLNPEARRRVATIRPPAA